jgi:FMN phosphatase YigB (HAD superfamily)
MVFETPGPRAVIFDLDGTLVDSRLDFPAMRAELQAPMDIGLLEYIEGLPTAGARRSAMAVVHRHEMTGGSAAPYHPAHCRLLTDFRQLVAWAVGTAP